MKKEYKNFGYMLAGIIIATLLLNPTFASQISSNLVKGFVAITSTDAKSENNLVGLDAGGKLPTDIIPASAATTGGETSMFIHRINYYSDSTYYTCPSGYIEVKGYGANRSDAYGSLMQRWKGNGDRFGHLVDNVFKDGCREAGWDHDADSNISENLWMQAYKDSTATRCTKVTSCTKIY